jgi:hypothetical protein
MHKAYAANLRPFFAAIPREAGIQTAQHCLLPDPGFRREDDGESFHEIPPTGSDQQSDRMLEEMPERRKQFGAERTVDDAVIA